MCTYNPVVNQTLVDFPLLKEKTWHVCEKEVVETYNECLLW